MFETMQFAQIRRESVKMKSILVMVNDVTLKLSPMKVFDGGIEKAAVNAYLLGGRERPYKWDISVIQTVGIDGSVKIYN